MRSTLPPVAAALALSLLAAAASAAEPSKKVAEFLGAEAVEVLKAPEKVECFRLEGTYSTAPKEDPEAEKAVKRIRGYPIAAQGKDQDAAFGGKLAAVLFDEKSYDFENSKKCLPKPGVAFRVWKGKASLDVLLCFECDLVIAATGDKKPLEAMEDFDNARAALVALAKTAFPDDKTIQNLKEKE